MLAVVVKEGEGDTVVVIVGLLDAEDVTDVVGEADIEVLADTVGEVVDNDVANVEADAVGVVLGVIDVVRELNMVADGVTVVVDTGTDGHMEVDIDGVELTDGEGDTETVMDADGDDEVNGLLDSRVIVLRRGWRNGAGDVDGDREGLGRVGLSTEGPTPDSNGSSIWSTVTGKEPLS